MDEKLTLSVTEVAKALGISRNTAYECIQRGEIPSLRLGRRVVVPWAALERKLNEAGRANECDEGGGGRVK